MAIKVNGTTVIDDSRNFTNINSGFKTVNGTSVVGSGDISAGASTTNGAVGTYALAGNKQNSTITWGGTRSGSNLVLNNGGNGFNNTFNLYADGGSTLSGTWRLMNGKNLANSYGDDCQMGMWVRIS